MDFSDSRARAVRASDDDRERIATQLKGHAAAGRISMDELSERLTVVYAARTLGELESLLLDLPGAVAAPPAVRRARHPSVVRTSVAVCVVLAALVILPAVVSTAFGLVIGAAALFFTGIVLLVPLLVLAAVVWCMVRFASRERAPTRVP